MYIIVDDRLREHAEILDKLEGLPPEEGALEYYPISAAIVAVPDRIV